MSAKDTMTVPVELIESMKTQLEQQDRMLRKLTELPLQHATVIGVHDNSVTIAADQAFLDVEMPDFSLYPGDSVVINGDTKQIIRHSPMPQVGGIGSVKTLINAHFCEVDIDGQSRIVAKAYQTVKVGDKVVLSGGNAALYAVLPQEKGERFLAETMTDVSWDQIGGQRAAKQAMQEAIVLPSQHPELFKSYGKSFPGGVLLYGASGNGKTLLGKATATALKKAGDRSGFFAIKGPEVLDPYVGETERKIRDLFRAARSFKQRTGHPGVIFIDEAEAVLSARGSLHGVSGMEHTIVPTFLAEMDGLEESSAIVMLATNRPEQLDPAIVRDGRMDRKIQVASPDADDALEILAIHLRSVPIAKGTTSQALAETIVTAIYDGQITTDHGVCLHTIVSGAMLEGIVEQAKSFALQRDLANGKIASGLRAEDAKNALDRICSENSRIAHAA